ncbi:MAG: hydrogenase expression protein HupH [Gammaproteobacteria bacterium]|jgi:allantoin racemase|nr:hydrogenase expression protein HupH [Gammaproteobacteria bacterium]
MSKRIKVIFPVPMNEHTKELIETQIPREFIGEHFEVDFVGSKRLMSLANSYYDTFIMDSIVIEAGMKAEEEGFDAVCINTVSDSGMNALRARLNIPVIGPGQAAFHMACTLGHKFSILTMWEPWVPLYTKTLTEYGLNHRCASIRHINTRPDVQELLEGKEEVVFAKLEAEALKAIEEDGANVIVLGSTTMHQSHRYLQEKLPVPVINPGVVAYKLCELLLDLELSHSKKAYPAPETLQDELLFPSFD